MLTSLATYIPSRRLDVSDLESQIEGFDSTRLIEKTGISSLARSGEPDYASTLAFQAAFRLIKEKRIRALDIDFLVVVTQTPDFLLPGVSNLLHSELGLRKNCLTFDLNDGCSGFVKGSQIMSSLLSSGLGACGLLVTVDTYSRIIGREDRSTLPLFGDGASAALFEAGSKAGLKLVDSTFVSIPNSAGALIAGNGLRNPQEIYGAHMRAEGISRQKQDELFMDGKRVLRFAIEEVPSAIAGLLARNKLELNDVALFAVHQANALVVSSLAEALGLTESRMPFMSHFIGNVTSSSIPYVLERSGALSLPDTSYIVIAGFGVGLSLGAQLLRVQSLASSEH
jgi:3-oxoacyl-[acyl-carrier-protein] synthase III